MIITEVILDTYFKSLNDSQALILGVNRRKRGWRKRLNGKTIPDSDFKEAIAIKGLSVSQRKQRLNKKLNVSEENVSISNKKNDNVYKVYEKRNREKITLIDVSRYYLKINSSNPKKVVHKKLKEFIKHYNKNTSNFNPIQSSNVYLIADNDGTFKIGKANDVYRRLKSLQTGASKKLTILKYIKVRFPSKTEGFIHDLFSSHRVNGEWFKLDDTQLLYITKVMNRLDEGDILKERD